MIAQQVYVPALGWRPVTPLQYGDFMYLYENGRPGAERYAALFQRTLRVDVTDADVRAMRPWIPTLLEYAILNASGYLDHLEDDDESSEAEEEEAPPEDSIWAAHSKNTAREARETADVERSDLVYALHENGESYESLYGLTMPEIETLMEGAERAHQRAHEQDDSGGGGDGRPGSGGRRDRAAQLGFR